MGRIKSLLVKRASEKLLKEEKFSDSFEDNKRILGTSMPSKRIRNITAGYITRLNRKTHAKQKSFETDRI